MMAFGKFLNGGTAFAVVVPLLLGLVVTRVEACRCLPAGLYEGYKDADIVLHATALNRSEQMDTYDDVIYTLDTITVYKEDVDVILAQEVRFTTRGNSFICGAELELGEEYLVGLYRWNVDNLSANSCGLLWEWSWLSEEDETSLEAGCEDDPCDGWCHEFQECLYDHYGSPGEYYCADVCDPTPCDHGEVCSLEDIECGHSPCPPVANCTVSYELNER